MSSQDYIGRKEYEKRQREQEAKMADMGRFTIKLEGMIIETRSMVEHLSKLTDERFAAAREALRVALAALEKRLDQMNEFRAQLDKQAATFVTRELVDSMMAGMETDIGNVRRIVEAVQQIQASTGGKAAGSAQTNASWLATLLQVAALIATVVVVVVYH